MPRLLIIEPDRQLARTIDAYMSRHYSVVVVPGAQQAIEAADTAKPDLVVLELAMAQHNGVAFLQEFRSYTDWIEVPVIIYSHIPIEDTGLLPRQWEKHGIVKYLYKPTVRLADLYDHIEHALKNYETA